MVALLAGVARRPIVGALYAPRSHPWRPRRRPRLLRHGAMKEHNVMASTTESRHLIARRVLDALATSPGTVCEVVAIMGAPHCCQGDETGQPVARKAGARWHPGHTASAEVPAVLPLPEEIVIPVN